MVSFTTRVELHDAVSNDYTKLHVEMKRKGFTQTITSDKGVVYHLPTAEYNYIGDVKRDAVLELAKAASAIVKKSYSIIVTQSGGRTWHNLPVV